MNRTTPVAIALLAAAPLLAHITLAEPSAPAGSYHAAFFRVGHGCGDSPTLSLSIDIPPSVTAARPQPKPGWALAVGRAPLAAPVRGEGGRVDATRVATITWTGRLQADQFDQFGVLLKLPDTPGRLYFPTRQRCANGTVAWTAIPAPDQPRQALKTPAPVLEVTPATGPGMAPMHM